MFLAWNFTGDIGWMEVIRTWAKSISNRLKESNEIRHSEQSTIPKRSLICATSHISRVKSAIMKRRRRVDVGESSSQMKPDPIQILRPLLQFITMSFIDNSIITIVMLKIVNLLNYPYLQSHIKQWATLGVSVEYMWAICPLTLGAKTLKTFSTSKSKW